MAKRSSLPLDCIDGCVPYTILDISDKEDILVEERRVPFPVDEYIEILLQSDQYARANVWTKVIVKEWKTRSDGLPINMAQKGICNTMCRRLSIYLKEMYPILPRFALGLIIFGEIHFIILLNAGIRDFRLGLQELIGGFTVFSFLLWLRIADDFKDYELDCRLFAHRPLPSGRVNKKELVIFVSILIVSLTFHLRIK